MIFNWSLRDSKSPQVSRTLLSILADLNHAVVSMIAARLLISVFSSPLTTPLGTISSAPIITRNPIIIIIIIIYSFGVFDISVN